MKKHAVPVCINFSYCKFDKSHPSNLTGIKLNSNLTPNIRQDWFGIKSILIRILLSNQVQIEHPSEWDYQKDIKRSFETMGISLQ
jgi:hypothetical protein